MTEQEIQARIEKKEKDIEKVEKRIAKWTEGMNDEAKALAAACEIAYGDPKLTEVRDAWKAYKDAHGNDPTVYRQDSEWNKGPNFDEAYGAYRDLAEQKKVLEKYKSQLSVKSNFNNMEKIPAIWDFLQNWKVRARKYFIQNAEEYAQLRADHERAKKEYMDEYLSKNPEYKDSWRAVYAVERRFDQDYYSNIHAVTISLYKGQGKLDEEKLEKFLDAEVESKYKNLVARITEKAGTILDAGDLHISRNGEINGIVIGDKNKVSVETIGAGGYNTDTIVNVKHGQIFHFRTLVHIIK